MCSLLGVLNMILLDSYQYRNVSSHIRMIDCWQLILTATVWAAMWLNHNSSPKIFVGGVKGSHHTFINFYFPSSCPEIWTLILTADTNVNPVSSPCPACRHVLWGPTCRRWPECRLQGSSRCSWLCGADRLHEQWWRSWSWARTSTGRWYLKRKNDRFIAKKWVSTAFGNSMSDSSK